MNRLFAISILCLCVGASSFAENRERDDYKGCTLWPIMSEASLSGATINLLSGDLGEMNGFALGGAFEKSGISRGVVIGGLSVESTRELKGLSIAGAASVLNDFSGANIGGLLWQESRMQHGWSLSGISTAKTVYGWQDGLLYAKSRDVAGCQSSVILAINDRSLRGCQIGLITYATGSLDGCQIGLVNISRNKFSGCQIGLINVAPGTWSFPIVNIGSCED